MEFEALVHQHKNAVYRQMLRVCGNREDAEDVLVDALLRAWQNLDRLQDSGAFRAWLTQIARRVCWNVRRREALLPMLQLSALPGAGTDVAAAGAPMEAKIEAQRMKDILTRALNEMPSTYREVYQLRDLDGLSGEEVSSRLGISVASMKSRLHRARTLLRVRLESEFRGEHRD